MSRLTPDLYVSDVFQLDLDALAAEGVRALVLDIDNTLEPYEHPDPTEPILRWFARLGELGIRAAFVSNNGRERVERFNRPFGFPYYYKAKKPFGRNVRRAMRELGARENETVLIGDQIFTDVLAARRAGIRAFLVDPIKDKTDIFTRLKRLLERPIKRAYRKEHQT